MKSPRLLPIVIFAVSALLLFKGIGLVTGDGYALTGARPAIAAEAAPDPSPPDADSSSAGAAPPADGSGTPASPTIDDPSPTVTDGSPTLAVAPDAAEGASGQAAPAEAGAAGGKPAAPPPPPPAPGTVAALTAAGVLPGSDAGVPVCPPGSKPADEDSESGKKPVVTAPTPGVNCDAAATTVGPSGEPVPVNATGSVSPTEQKLIDRLNQRSAELDKLAASLGMRQAVVEAAEKQMQTRADALKSLQDQIQTLQDQKKSVEDSQFASVVKMYETMKPQQAAAIFDGLDMGVLLRVAEAMDPRKMSPILAQMASTRAQQLTTQMAARDPSAADGTPSPADPNALPQIVGH